MDADRANRCRTSYDAVADEYMRRISDELQHKPLDRELLDRFAARVREVGPACDIGCGPGHVARYLHNCGVHVCGIDLSPEMVRHAQLLTPDVEFRQGNMLALDAPNEAWAGITAFYSIIHIPIGDMVRTLAEVQRVLRPGGLLLCVFHIGDETVRLEEWWGRSVDVDFYFFRTEEIVECLRTVGFEVEEVIERDPYPDVEYKSRRAYVFARRPKARG